jgi:hypothetical protein
VVPGAAPVVLPRAELVVVPSCALQPAIHTLSERPFEHVSSSCYATSMPTWTTPDTGRAHRRGRPAHARERGPGYAAGGGTGPAAPSLRDAVGELSRAVQQVLDLAVDGRTGGGELGALLELLPALDLGYAAAVAITDTALQGSLAERRAGLSYDALLSMRTRSTYTERGRLQRLARLLRQMPHLRAAYHHGRLGTGQVLAIAAEAKVLQGEALAALDACFADLDRLERLDPDQLLDLVRVEIDRHRVDLAEARETRAVETSYLHLQPRLDGSGEGHFAFDADAFAAITTALDAAAAPPTADGQATHGSEGGEDQDEIDAAPFGPASDRPRTRQHADALLAICEDYLAGPRQQRPGRPRTRATVVLDVAHLVEGAPTARAARLLWRMLGSPPALTAAGVRRFCSDTDLQFLLTDGHTILGITAPTPTIPRRLRDAVHARDQGCRFPGCRAPLAWCDLHHVIAREHGGPTTVDNLVALCRRHHTAITTGRWQLSMTPDGTVSVRRGRHTATTDPPLHTTLAPPHPPDTS